MPTLLGYSGQGACKFGFYEFFKKYYSDLAGPEFTAKYKTLIYLAGSASAEVIADIALCPFEAVKVRVQTQPGFARGLSDGLPKFVKSEGALGYVFDIITVCLHCITQTYEDHFIISFFITRFSRLFVYVLHLYILFIAGCTRVLFHYGVAKFHVSRQ